MSKFLHETRKMIENLTKEVEDLKRVNMQVSEQNIELKQQLAEKDNTINTLIEDSKASKDLLKKQLAEKEKERHEEWKTGKEWKWAWQKEHNNKISFAVEQLEKVKEDTKNAHIEDTQYDCYCFQETTRDKCVKIIDNQIKQLKEEK